MLLPEQFSPRPYARLGGVLYLAIISLGLFGEMYARGTLIVPSDAAATLANISASPLLWRLSIVADLLMQSLDVPVIVIFYLLFRPVSEGLALLASLTNIVQTAVLACIKLSLLVPVLLVDTSALDVVTPAQLAAFSKLAIDLHAHGYAIGLVFFGFSCLAQGVLIRRSGFMPRVFGTMLMLAGFCYLLNSFALLLAPALARLMFPAVMLPVFVGELSFALWLTVKGVDPVRWQERLGASR